MLPEELYASKRIQAFIRRCKQAKVNWAIFSDLYGVWFPNIRRRWYEKSPDSVTSEEFKELVSDFKKKLHRFTKIYFYYHPARFHRLYRKLLNVTDLRNKIVLLTRVIQII
jgi:hypothetical protein